MALLCLSTEQLKFLTQYSVFSVEQLKEIEAHIIDDVLTLETTSGLGREMLERLVFELEVTEIDELETYLENIISDLEESDAEREQTLTNPLAETPYSDNLEILTALISHLGLVQNKSRVPSRIAVSIGWERAEVERVLNEFKGIFRKSSRRSPKTKQHYYTLQLRYSLKHSEYQKAEDNKISSDEARKEFNQPGSPLEVSDIISLIEYVSNRAEQETARHLTLKEIHQTYELTEKELKQNQQLTTTQFDLTKEAIENSKDLTLRGLDQNKENSERTADTMLKHIRQSKINALIAAGAAIAVVLLELLKNGAN